MELTTNILQVQSIDMINFRASTHASVSHFVSICHVLNIFQTRPHTTQAVFLESLEQHLGIMGTGFSFPAFSYIVSYLVPADN